MKTTPFLIAAAAFAVTATGVYAQGNAEKILVRANLSEEQKSALFIAHDLKNSGDFVAARDTLIEAGFDEEKLRSLREARRAVHAEIKAAVEAEDYDAFVEASIGTPMEERVTSKEAFSLLVEAHNARQAGDTETAREIMNELDLNPKDDKKGHAKKGSRLSLLTDAQMEAFQEARRSNDKKTAQAILDEAGIEYNGSRTHR